MKVYPCTTKVTILISNIQAVITCISIRFDKIQYEVTFFHEGKHDTLWVNELEFSTEAVKTKIGYK